jgi:hypothetical protein
MGTSESSQNTALRVNIVLSSTPTLGVTEKMPGEGGALVTTTTATCAEDIAPRLAQVKVKVSEVPAGSE